MPTSQELAFRLYGAWRLLRGDRGAMAFFDGRVESFWNSFFAAVLVAPLYFIKALMSLAEGEPAGGPLQNLTVHAIAFAMSWIAFPVVFHAVIDLVDRRGRYAVYIVAFNWCKVIQWALYLPIILLEVAGLAGKEILATFTLLITVVVLAYQWFVARTALDVSGLAAAGIVGLELLVSLVILLWADSIIF